MKDHLLCFVQVPVGVGTRLSAVKLAGGELDPTWAIFEVEDRFVSPQPVVTNPLIIAVLERRAAAVDMGGGKVQMRASVLIEEAFLEGGL